MTGPGGRSGKHSPGGSPVMRGLGRRSGAAAALLLGLLVATPASPAGAQEAAAITIDSPRAEPPLGSASVTVSGSARSATLYRVGDVTLTIGSETKTKTCSDSPCSFSWTVSRPSNGRYDLKLVATQALPLVGTPGPSIERSRTFYVAAPAAKPVLDPPTVNEARNTELSWSRNTEPDMLYYAVFRRDPGSSKDAPIGSVPQPKSGAKVSFTDTTTSAFTGGDYKYQVVAVRKGAGGAWPEEIASEPSSVRTAAVPAPPTTSTTAAAAPPGSPPPSAAPTTTVKPGTSAGVDLSGFLSTRSQPISLPAITVPEPPDTGFQGTLPFGARPPGEELEEGEEEAVLPDDAPRSIISRISPGRPLVPVAGGLVLLLLAMHMRVLNHRIKDVPEKDLPVGDAPPAPAPMVVRASAPVPEPEPAPEPARAPAPVLYDVDEDWAPVAAEPEPEPVALWAPAEIDDITEPEPEPVALWAPAEIDDLDEPEPEPEPEPVDPDEIEVFEVVSSNRRRLARAGAR